MALVQVPLGTGSVAKVSMSDRRRRLSRHAPQSSARAVVLIAAACGSGDPAPSPAEAAARAVPRALPSPDVHRDGEDPATEDAEVTGDEVNEGGTMVSRDGVSSD